VLKKMTSNNRLIPIYTSRGEVGALLAYPYIFNRQGEWIGWVTPERSVYSVHGHYVGFLNDDPRILRKPSSTFARPRQMPPSRPEPITPPAHFPLAPMMAEVYIGTIDVLEEEPHLLPAVDFGDLRDDMD
jgi:hypothetical protein